MFRPVQSCSLALLLGPLAFGFLAGASSRGAPGSELHALPATAASEQYVESTLYAFQGSTDGAEPMAGLTVGASGTLYGTEWGGPNWGTVFSLTRSGSGYIETTLHTFSGYPTGDGAEPRSVLITGADGALYGTTAFGGINGAGCFDSGCGTVFKLVPDRSGYTERVLYRFQGGADGSNPWAGVVADKRGALYGTEQYSGTSQICQGGCGTVFKLTRTRAGYTERVLYDFQGGEDGGNPQASLLLGERGTLYGTTYIGGTGCPGYGCGVVFALTPSRGGYKQRVVYGFKGGTDGAGPLAGLITDGAGGLYGTTVAGGGSGCQIGCGTVFKLTPGRSSFKETVLHRFVPPNDGLLPRAGLVMDESGALYGTTYTGGGAQCGGGCGTVYKLTPMPSGAYSESILFAFHGTTDGAFPYAALIVDQSGALYGTASEGGGGGGKLCGDPRFYGCGVAFRLVP